jgi:Family of unknown function (DUF6152)
MRAKSALVVAGVWLLLAALPVWAHHAFSSEFDISKPLKMQGTLTKWEMINPHSWFHIDVKGPDGTVVPWLVEGGTPNQLIRLGVTKNTLPIGIEFVIEGYQAKDGSNRAVGRNFVLADGRRLFLGGNTPGAGGAADPDK